MRPAARRREATPGGLSVAARGREGAAPGRTPGRRAPGRRPIRCARAGSASERRQRAARARPGRRRHDLPVHAGLDQLRDARPGRCRPPARRRRTPPARPSAGSRTTATAPRPRRRPQQLLQARPCRSRPWNRTRPGRRRSAPAPRAPGGPARRRRRRADAGRGSARPPRSSTSTPFSSEQPAGEDDSRPPGRLAGDVAATSTKWRTTRSRSGKTPARRISSARNRLGLTKTLRPGRTRPGARCSQRLDGEQARSRRSDPPLQRRRAALQTGCRDAGLAQRAVVEHLVARAGQLVVVQRHHAPARRAARPRRRTDGRQLVVDVVAGARRRAGSRRAPGPMPRRLIGDHSIRADRREPAGRRPRAPARAPPGTGTCRAYGSGGVVLRVRHAEERDLVAGAALQRGDVEHVALGAAAAVEELVDVEDAHRACSRGGLLNRPPRGKDAGSAPQP